VDVRLAARYPFLKDSAKYLRDQGVTLDKLVTSRAYESARMRGRDRVLEVLDGNMIQDHPTASEVEATLELLSYPIARMIVSTIADPMFVKRYAIAEAKLARKWLRNAELDFVVKTAGELGLQVSRDDVSLAVDFTDFLKYSSVMRSKEWKLINQDVRSGKVILNAYKVTRLMEQLITDRITSELPLEVNDQIIAAFAPVTEEIRTVLEEQRKARQTEGVGKVSIVLFPPCMRKLLAMIQAGENVPHSGRFALVAFLHALGKESEEILHIFSSAPDFDESKAMYQIKHIIGESSGTEYTTPECSTMKSYGICYDPDSLCNQDWMKHPLQYFRAKGRRLKPKAGISKSRVRAATR
jgi:DNA primase large subunit